MATNISMGTEPVNKQFRIQLNKDEIEGARKNGYNVDDNGILWGNAKIRKNFEHQRKRYIAQMLKKAKNKEKKEDVDETDEVTAGA